MNVCARACELLVSICGSVAADVGSICGSVAADVGSDNRGTMHSIELRSYGFLRHIYYLGVEIKLQSWLSFVSETVYAKENTVCPFHRIISLLRKLLHVSSEDKQEE